MMIKPLLVASLLLATAAPQLSIAQNRTGSEYGPDIVLAQNNGYNYRDDHYDGNRPPPPPAGAPAVFSDNARVVRVQPRIEQVSMPQEECRNEVETVQAPNNNGGRGLGGALIGGIAGGILGNQVGGGSGRTAATAIGAIGGALAGENVANNTAAPQGYAQREVRRCHTVNRVVERPNGYDVTYQYQGRNYSTVMANSPGSSIRVNVLVTPAY
ncbi:MAG: glycine zipper 2TM domain-containing protein [Janthinobacterium lividum]